MKHIFVSYADEDRDFARKLSRKLRESDRIPWQDFRNIRGGQYWQAAIDDALRKAEALVVIMSPNAIKSQYVTYEWAFALGADIPVIPVLRRGRPTEVHSKLRSMQYIDFTKRRGSPWVNLRLALPSPTSPVRSKAPAKVRSTAASKKKQARPSTSHAGPKIKARFNVVSGKPEMLGGFYVIKVHIHGAPRGAKQVTYEVLDETRKRETKWPTRSVKTNFEATFLSNGDTLMTASISTPGKKSLRIASSLYEALRRGHGSNHSPQIRSALREIHAWRES